MVEEGFTEIDASEYHERDDHAFAEYERVEASRCNVIGNANAEASENIGASSSGQSGVFIAPPSLDEAQLALDNLKKILRPPRTSHAEHGGYKDPRLDSYLRTRLEEMKQFLWTYVNPQSTVYNKWTAASLHMANYLEKKPHHAQLL